MVGHGAKLGRKQGAAISGLAHSTQSRSGCPQVGVVPNTLLRWQQDPEFDKAYRKARRAACGQGTASLQQWSNSALG